MTQPELPPPELPPLELPPPEPLPVVVPQELVDSQVRYFGDAGLAWVAGLAALAGSFLQRWELTLDGPPASGAVALVLPVLRANGTPAALKLQPVDDETRDEAVALRCWSGRGAVAVLEDDPGSGTILLQRLDATRPLSRMGDDVAACAVIAQLLHRLHAVRAPARMRRLDEIASAMLEEVPRTVPLLPDPDERRLLTGCADRLRELLASPVPDRLLHWDLHYDNVLARYRGEGSEPWLAIDPKPLAGDPGFDLMPALWNRWADVVATGDVTRAVLRRFDVMTEVLALDRLRAAGWTLARVLQNAIWDLGRLGQPGLEPSHRAIVEALLTRPG